MAASADPLRNTLDHLALDPAGKDDRKYLVSMLRRLGYSEREIQKAVGGGERIIEIEYTGTGRVPSRPREDAFEVVSEDEQFSLDNDDFESVEEWTEEWPEDEPELVEFKQREATGPVGFSVTKKRQWEDVEDPAVSAGWVPVDEEDIGAPAAPPGDAWEPTTGEGGWGEDESGQWEAPAEQDDDWGAAEDDWEPFAEDAETSKEPIKQDDTSWEADDSAPEWEAADESVDEIVEFEETDQGDWDVKSVSTDTQETEDESPWRPSGDVSRASKWLDEDHQFDDEPEAPAEPEEQTLHATPAQSPAPEEVDVAKAEQAVDRLPEEGYEYGEYTLYTRTVELSTGRKQRIYFFAKGDPKSGVPAPLPKGYVVERNQRTGLPFLRRNSDEPVAEPEEDEATETVRCVAVTKGGTQCKNGARENSKYCGTHKGWRGPRVD